jgi:ribosomal protein S18 acetylase RimI-like enzyme
MSISPPCRVRRLSTADADAFRALRLEGLERHPSAFGASYEEESSRPPSWFADGLDKGLVLGAEREERLVGVAGFQIESREKARHRGVLWGMYVTDEARGSGVGRLLVADILAHARGRVEEVTLNVEAGNAAAIACYRSAGFREAWRDERAVKIDGVYFDVLTMKLRF